MCRDVSWTAPYLWFDLWSDLSDGLQVAVQLRVSVPQSPQDGAGGGEDGGPGGETGPVEKVEEHGQLVYVLACTHKSTPGD